MTIESTEEKRMKRVKARGNGWAKPTKTTQWHWFEDGYAICNAFRTSMPLIVGYVLKEHDFGVLACANCRNKFRHRLYKASSQIQRLQLVLGREDVA